MELYNPTRTRSVKLISRPITTIQRNERAVEGRRGRDKGRRTLFRTVESNKKLLHAVVHKADFVVGHQPTWFRSLVSYQDESKPPFGGHAQFHDIGLNPALSWVTVLGWHSESIPAI